MNHHRSESELGCPQVHRSESLEFHGGDHACQACLPQGWVWEHREMSPGLGFTGGEELDGVIWAAKLS